MLRKHLKHHCCRLLDWSAKLWFLVEGLHVLDANYDLSCTVVRVVTSYDRFPIVAPLGHAFLAVWTFIATHSAWWVLAVVPIVIRQEWYRWLRSQHGRRDVDRLITAGATYLGTLIAVSVLTHRPFVLPHSSIDAVIVITVMGVSGRVSRFVHRIARRFPKRRIVKPVLTALLQATIDAILPGGRHGPGGRHARQPHISNQRRTG